LKRLVLIIAMAHHRGAAAASHPSHHRSTTPTPNAKCHSIELGRAPSVFTAAKLMSTMIYRNKDNLMGACLPSIFACLT
jgi:hypothetical protein